LLVLGTPTFGNQMVTFNATGGTGTIEYSFDGGNFSSNNTISDFVPGQDYTVAVRDANGCVKTETFSLSVVDATTNLTIDCSGDTGADIEVIATGGLSPYTYSLDGTTFVSGNIFTGIPSGDQTYYVMDAAGFQYTFTEADIPTYPIDISANVDGNDVEIRVANGVGQYRYKIDSEPFSFSSSFTDLPDGEYIFTVRDANDCEVSTTVVISTSSVDNLNNRLLFEIYPNPSNGAVTLKIDQATNRSMMARVYDIAGRLVYEERFQKQSLFLEKQFNLSLRSGNYIMTIDDGQFLGRKQLIVIE